MGTNDEVYGRCPKCGGNLASCMANGCPMDALTTEVHSPSPSARQPVPERSDDGWGGTYSDLWEILDMENQFCSWRNP